MCLSKYKIIPAENYIIAKPGPHTHTHSPVLVPTITVVHTDERCVTHWRTVQTFWNILSLYNVRVVQSLQDLHLPIPSLQGLTAQIHETTFFKNYQLSRGLGRRGARKCLIIIPPPSSLPHLPPTSPFLSPSLASYLPSLGNKGTSDSMKISYV